MRGVLACFHHGDHLSGRYLLEALDPLGLGQCLTRSRNEEHVAGIGARLRPSQDWRALTLRLTTVEAARMLGVSRQFLIGQLEKGEIPFHMVGTHRRIYVRDVLAYKMQRDGKRRRILDDLTRAEAEEGLYDREPSDDHAD